MATVTITITDVGERVSVKSDPTFEEMAKMINSGTSASAAQAYALAAINHIREESKKQGEIQNVIPRVLKTW